MADPQPPVPSAQRLRPASVLVSYTPEQIAQLVKEVYDGTIAGVSLSLFSCWIRQKWENYEEAKKHIRELSVDLVTAPHHPSEISAHNANFVP